MENMKKVEIIIESVYINRLLDLFKNYEINGYTIIRDIEGCGGHGLRTADEVTDVFSNNYIFTVCTDSKFEEIKEEIRAFTKKYGGKCIVSDSMMLL
ncbi:transcriptional regulator [Halarcobacter mediterraneus]|uniref:Transcriptional regulator n=1 Tax=Halarcobacter mediterraneus TaxID=2023153 RepID=A0A4V1M1A4_9BACT|nr:transcriptional regulator [Halarcobacter mediterraneus]RXK12825.1 transcriptional regulator [Halarcobacter mediterraneus]